MKKAIIIYHTKTGTTKAFAERISHFLGDNNISVHLNSIGEPVDYNLSGFDYVILGCWTNGLLFMLQKPEKVWVDYASKLNGIDNSKLLLFTTYKILTGSMFSNMKKHLKFENRKSIKELKSRNGELDINSKKQLLDFIN